MLRSKVGVALAAVFIHSSVGALNPDCLLDIREDYLNFEIERIVGFRNGDLSVDFMESLKVNGFETAIARVQQRIKRSGADLCLLALCYQRAFVLGYIDEVTLHEAPGCQHEASLMQAALNYDTDCPEFFRDYSGWRLYG